MEKGVSERERERERETLMKREGDRKKLMKRGGEREYGNIKLKEIKTERKLGKRKQRN